MTLGQQAVYTDVNTVQKILRSHGCTPQPLPAHFDTRTKIPRELSSPELRNRTNAQTLFTLLGANEVHVLDVSDYEGADIVWDLNLPITKVHHNSFDVVYDGGTLEHVFDLPTALASVLRMISPGGAVILTNPVSNCVDHGFYSISPTLYCDYFTANGFGEGSCYLTESSQLVEGRSRVYTYSGPGRSSRFLSSRPVGLAFFATKLRDPLEIRKPIQSIYTYQNVLPTAGQSVTGAWLSVARFLKQHSPDWFVDTMVQQEWYRRSRQGIRFIAKW